MNCNLNPFCNIFKLLLRNFPFQRGVRLDGKVSDGSWHDWGWDESSGKEGDVSWVRLELTSCCGFGLGE